MQTPRYSILLPTRNGGPFLRWCIESVLEQDHDDFELVVADNANEDGTAEVLRAYASDPRLQVVRSEKVLSVTENWTAAFNASSGDYVLLIGDDDLLLPDFLSAIDAIVERHQQPDCVTFNGYRYVAPYSVDGEAMSYYAAPYFQYGADLPRDGLLSRALRHRLVERLYTFDLVAFPLTMQLTLVRRRAVERLPHGLFKSVFPDHYAVAGLLLTAERWVLVDQRLLVVGVSPKSFGHFFFNDDDEIGLDYLGVPVEFTSQLGGNVVVNATCSWLQVVLDDFRVELDQTEVDHGAYVARQVRHRLRRYQAGRVSGRDLARQMSTLKPRDLRAMARTYGHRSGLRTLAHAAGSQRRRRSDQLIAELEPLPGIANIAEFADWIVRRRGGRLHATGGGAALGHGA